MEKFNDKNNLKKKIEVKYFTDYILYITFPQRTQCPQTRSSRRFSSAFTTTL